MLLRQILPELLLLLQKIIEKRLIWLRLNCRSYFEHEHTFWSENLSNSDLTMADYGDLHVCSHEAEEASSVCCDCMSISFPLTSQSQSTNHSSSSIVIQQSLLATILFTFLIDGAILLLRKCPLDILFLYHLSYNFCTTFILNLDLSVSASWTLLF
ncbi:hypothetical protein GEMRC1_013532 [Eukaryota sp. GEM-RC1]